MLPKISIITIAYNSAATIEATLRSVVAQGYPRLEYIIIDGGSTDATLSIVEQYRPHLATVVSEPDRGISDAFNKGIAHSTGDIVGIINSDDELLPGALQAVAEAYQTHPADIYRGDIVLWNRDTDSRRVEQPSMRFPTMPFFIHVAHQGTFVTRQCYDRIGGYREDIRYSMDLDLLMRADRMGCTFHHVARPLALYAIGGLTTQHSIHRKKADFLRLIRVNGGNSAQAYTFYYYVVLTQYVKRLLNLFGHDMGVRLRYKQMKLVVLAMMLACCSALSAQQLTIMGTSCLTPDDLTVEDFRTFREAGFDVWTSDFWTPERAMRSLDMAQQAGVRCMVHLGNLLREPETFVPMLQSHPALYGYYLADEPKTPAMTQLGRVAQQIARLDSLHPCYVNLVPNYAPQQVRDFGADNYAQYLMQASSLMGLRQLSFDFYPVLDDNTLRPTWFETLELVRAESLRTKRPFWGYILSNSHGTYARPTLQNMRLQAYANLAYGAQALQYFTYLTPDRSVGFEFRDAPIDARRRKTRTYQMVQQLNRELHQVGRLFMGATITDVHHLGTHPQGTRSLRRAPSGLRRLTARGGQGVIVSQMNKGGEAYVVIVNKSPHQAVQLELQARSSLTRQVLKDLSEDVLPTSVTLPAGDIFIIHLARFTR